MAVILAYEVARWLRAENSDAADPHEETPYPLVGDLEHSGHPERAYIAGYFAKTTQER